MDREREVAVADPIAPGVGIAGVELIDFGQAVLGVDAVEEGLLAEALDFDAAGESPGSAIKLESADL